MKYFKILFLVIPLVLFINPSKAQSPGDKIVGFYLTKDDETKEVRSQVQIFRNTNGKYYGKIIWLKEPDKNGKPKVDKNNPDSKLQKRAIIGLEILKDFSYSKDDSEWSKGTIYNPISGKTYNCYIKFESPTSLKIRGFIGAAWMGLGKTVIWTKEDIQRK